MIQEAERSAQRVRGGLAGPRGLAKDALVILCRPEADRASHTDMLPIVQQLFDDRGVLNRHHRIAAQDVAAAQPDRLCRGLRCCGRTVTCPLITADGRMGPAPGVRCEIRVVES